ncbi:MAG: hypothetical protein ACYDCK_00450 [Thermoplasmatota archaeon]
MKRPQDEERAQFYVLEAIIVVTLMMMAVFWLAFDGPGTINGNSTNPHEEIYQDLEQSSSDNLHALWGLPPMEKSAGRNAEEGALTLAAWGHTKELKNYFDHTWQLGTGYELSYHTLGNPNHRDYTTIVTNDPGGSQSDEASASDWIQGKWSWDMTLPALTVSDGISPLDTVTAHIHDSKLALEPGDWLRAQIATHDSVPPHGDYTYPGETILSAPATASGLEMYLTTKDLDTTPVLDATMVHPPQGTALPLHLHICAGSSGPLDAAQLAPARPFLDFEMPPGWQWNARPGDPFFQPASGPQLFAAAQSTGTAANGHLFARLALTQQAHLGASQCAVEEFSIQYATGQGPITFSPLDIHWSNGLLGEIRPVIVDTGAPQAQLPRGVTVQAPYAIRTGDNVTIGALFENGGVNTNVTRVRLQIPGGYDPLSNGGNGVPLFDEVSGLNVVSPAKSFGTWSIVNARTIEWIGSIAVAADGAQDFVVNFTVETSATTTESQLQSDLLWRSNVSFPTSHHWENATLDPWSPGLAWATAPAAPIAPLDATKGYATLASKPAGSTSGNPIVERIGNASLRAYSSGASYGLGSSSLTSLGGLRNALANSTFNVTPHAMPLGGTATVTLDARSLSQTLAANGAQRM